MPLAFVIHVKMMIFPFSKAAVEMFSFCESPARWRILWENKSFEMSDFFWGKVDAMLENFFPPLNNLLKISFFHLPLLFYCLYHYPH